MFAAFRRQSRDMFRLCAFELVFCAYMAAYYSFVFVFLQSRGYSSLSIGSVLAVNALVATLSQPFWGIVSDKLQSIKKVFLFCLAASTLLYQLLPLCYSAFASGLVLAILNFFYGALTPLSDSWILQRVAGEEKIGYGHIRLWGCIGFAFASLLLGKLIAASSVHVIFPAFAVMGIATAVVCLTMKSEKPSLTLSIKDMKFGKLLGSYNYISFLLFATLFFVPIVSSETFFTPLLKSLGGNEEKLGLAFAVTAFSEVFPFFFSSYLLRKFKTMHLILASSCLYIVRQFLYFFSTRAEHLILIQILQGISFGIFLSSAIYYIDTIAPDELKATSQTLFGSLFYGAAAMAGSFLGGWYMERTDLILMYETAGYAALGIFSLFVVTLLLRRLLTSVHRTDTVNDSKKA